MAIPIYALIDRTLIDRYGCSIEEIASRIEESALPIAQYRDKSSSLRDIEEALKRLSSIFGGRVIVNDHVELAGAVDGVHIGQEDLVAYGPDAESAIATIRERVGDGIIGVSTHSPEEIEIANGLDIDYIGLGAYRNSGTKSVSSVGGERLVSYASASLHPVAIIGGIDWSDEFPEDIISYRVMGSALFERLCR